MADFITIFKYDMSINEGKKGFDPGKINNLSFGDGVIDILSLWRLNKLNILKRGRRAW